MQVDVEEVSGGLNLVFMGTSITNAYHNLTNIVLRISPKRALGQPAVLINAHFDSSFGSPGGPACCQRQPGCNKLTLTQALTAQPAVGSAPQHRLLRTHIASANSDAAAEAHVRLQGRQTVRGVWAWRWRWPGWPLPPQRCSCRFR